MWWCFFFLFSNRYEDKEVTGNAQLRWDCLVTESIPLDGRDIQVDGVTTWYKEHWNEHSHRHGRTFLDRWGNLNIGNIHLQKSHHVYS